MFLYLMEATTIPARRMEAISPADLTIIAIT